MRRLFISVIFFGLINMAVYAETNFWKDFVAAITRTASVSDIEAYHDGMEFYYFPSFRPIELFRFYQIEDKWYAAHSVFRRFSNAKIFDSAKVSDSMEVTTDVVPLDAKQLESILRQLRDSSFYRFKGDESEKRGFDGETFFFQYLKNGQRVSFSYWNEGLSIKNVQMNNIAKVFRSVEYDKK